MKDIKSAMVRNVLATSLVVALLAVMGLGQVQAQVTQDQAIVDASINVFEPVGVSAVNGDVEFGNVQIGNTNSVGPGSGASFTVESGSSFSPFEMELTWDDTPSFTSTETSSSFPWSPNVEVGGADAGSPHIVQSGDVIEVGGSVTVPDGTEDGSYTSELTFTVAYTNI